ncbi:MAG: PrsW family intramembrane metalloprotease [Burkholderiaceae bacterium]|nr:PrsW family intramembrane metalloprotease [Burkholderiaceae bacterium]MBP6815279.1 PrsW family intramembrane metalloprotease [Burkholderiaceae bacterium]MBP7659255.1 PrsW family intramembrane metalloprotease [Burkholderiaceae bacterium]
MEKRPGGQLRQGLAGLGSSVLLPGLARLREMPSKGMLVPGAILIMSVMGLFWSISRPMVGVPIAVARAGGRSLQLYMPLAFWIVALLCALGAVFFVYRLCGKERPWWALVVPALVMGLLMQEWFAHPWLVLFHDFLVGGLPPSRAWDSVPLPTLFAKVFFGVGLNEELWKAIPIGICVWVARNIQGPLGAQVGVREPLDGILVGVVCGTVFAVLETMGQYVPKMLLAGGANVQQISALIPGLAQQLTDVLAREGLRGAELQQAVNSFLPAVVQKKFLSLSGYESLLLTLARMLGDICGHAAYSGYIGYFIGLAVMRPAQWLKLLAIGFGVMVTIHTLWDVVQGEFLHVMLGFAAFASLVGAIVKARQLSPERAHNFASVVRDDARAAVMPRAADRGGADRGAADRAEARVATAEPAGAFTLQLGPRTIALSAGTQLMQGDVGTLVPRDGGRCIAEVVRRDETSDVLGLRNHSTQTWTMVFSAAGGMTRNEVPPGKTMRLIRQSRVNFGAVEGIVR